MYVFFYIGSDSIVQPLLYFTAEPSGTVYGAQFTTLCINCSASCTVSGAVNMMWRKDDRAIVNNSQGYSLSNDSLCIENLSKSMHEGFYECIAQHPIGTLVSSKVKVEEAGKFSYSVLFIYYFTDWWCIDVWFIIGLLTTVILCWLAAEMLLVNVFV